MKTKLHTTEQASEILNLTTGMIRRICRQRNIGCRIGRDWALTDDDLKKIINREDKRKKSK